MLITMQVDSESYSSCTIAKRAKPTINFDAEPYYVSSPLGPCPDTIDPLHSCPYVCRINRRRLEGVCVNANLTYLGYPTYCQECLPVCPNIDRITTNITSYPPNTIRNILTSCPFSTQPTTIRPTSNVTVSRSVSPISGSEDSVCSGTYPVPTSSASYGNTSGTNLTTKGPTTTMTATPTYGQPSGLCSENGLCTFELEGPLARGSPCGAVPTLGCEVSSCPTDPEGLANCPWICGLKLWGLPLYCSAENITIYSYPNDGNCAIYSQSYKCEQCLFP